MDFEYIDTLEEFYKLLDIDDESEFQYFENIAEYFEFGGDISYECVAKLVEKLDLDVLAELFKEYFNDVTNSVPASETELFSLIENISMVFRGLAKNPDDHTVVSLSDEMEKFRRWYSIDLNARVKPAGEADEKHMTLRGALMLSRLEKLQGEKYDYNFCDALNYEMDEYIVSFKDLVEDSAYDYYDDDDDFDDEPRLDDGFEVIGGRYHD